MNIQPEANATQTKGSTRWFNINGKLEEEALADIFLMDVLNVDLTECTIDRLDGEFSMSFPIDADLMSKQTTLKWLRNKLKEFTATVE